MSWNYRVIKHIDKGREWYAIHEVYYNNGGLPDSCTKEPVYPSGEDVGELNDDFEYYKSALSKPYLDISTFDKEGSDEPL